MKKFDWSSLAKEFMIILEEAVNKRLVCPLADNIKGAKVSILFSGGLDSTVLAALVDRYQLFYITCIINIYILDVLIVMKRLI